MKHLLTWLILGSLWGCQGSTHHRHQKSVKSTSAKDTSRSKTATKAPVKLQSLDLPEKIPNPAPPVKTIPIPYNASAGKKRALLAQEAYENPRDQRTYGGNPKAKAQGKKLDCSYFIREIDATFHSAEARTTKQRRGYLQPHELVKYNPFFTTKRLYANKLTSMSGKMADVLQKHGVYSTRVADVRLGDYVFIGKGKNRNLKSISHTMVINKIDTVAGHPRYHFIDAGYKGIKKVNGVIKRVKRSVRSGYYLTHKGTVWSGKYIRYFKGGGRPKKK